MKHKERVQARWMIILWCVCKVVWEPVLLWLGCYEECLGRGDYLRWNNHISIHSHVVWGLAWMWCFRLPFNQSEVRLNGKTQTLLLTFDMKISKFSTFLPSMTWIITVSLQSRRLPEPPPVSELPSLTRATINEEEEDEDSKSGAYVQIENDDSGTLVTRFHNVNREDNKTGNSCHPRILDDFLFRNSV